MPDDLARVPVVAVASGKGGVGKTTTAVNLALALSADGLRVGLVDADLYGPDAAHMMGLRRTQDAAHVTVFAPSGSAASRLEAAHRHGIQLASAALLIGEAQGLGVQAAIAQLLVQRLIASTSWDNPDCLVVDLPPGTADIQQLVFASGNRTTLALLVVTPQLIAHRDAHRLLHELDRGEPSSSVASRTWPARSARTAAKPRLSSCPLRRRRRSGPGFPSWPACRSALRRRGMLTGASRS